jgi:glycosyltransferase involved in cell wall biosynthesis
LDVRLFYYPRYKNPYQTLLYAQFPASYRIEAAPLEHAVQALAAQPGAKVIFHLHWEDVLYKEVPDEAGALQRIERFIATARRYKAMGGKIAWTIHNLASHEAGQAARDEKLRKELSALVDVAFVHTCTGEALVLRELAGLAGRLVVAPHGNYADAYPYCCAREQARETFGYSGDDVVFLAFGMVRAYKRIDWVLQAAQAALPRSPQLKVLVAGERLAQLGPVKLEPQPRNARMVLKRIPDARVQAFFAAADFCVFANNRGLTSGSMILALTFGVPVIAFRTGDAAELIADGREGFLAADDSPAALTEVMLRAAAASPPERARMSQEAAAHAARLGWQPTARIHQQGFEALFNR